MEKDTKIVALPPAHKAVRGFASSIDVSDQFILYFNANTVVLRPHEESFPTLSLSQASDITAAKFSHDGKLLASIDARGTLLISEPLQDKILAVYQYEGVFPNAKYLDWSADKKKVCIVGEGKNKFAKIISIDTGVTAGDIASVTATLNSCSFRPERPYKLVMGGDEYTLKCFDGPPYSFVKSDKSHTNFINQVKYSPKGGYILSGAADRKLVLYQGKTYQKLAEKQNAHGGSVFGLDWIDEEHFVTVSADKIFKIWNIKFEEIVAVPTVSEEDLKNPKKIGDFLLGVKSHKDKLYILNLQGDILIYNNFITTKQTTLIKKLSGTRSKIANLLTLDEENVMLLDSGGRILAVNIASKRITVVKADNDLNLILNGFVKREDKIHVLVLAGNGNVYKFEGGIGSQYLLVNKLQNLELAHISQGRTANQLIGIYQNKLALIDFKSSKIMKECTLDEDVGCLYSNGSYICVGTLKGKLLIFNYQLQNIHKSTLKTFKISAIKLIPINGTNHFHCVFGDTSGVMSCIKIAQNGVQTVKETMGGHNSVITSIDYDGQFLYGFGMDGKVTFWSLTNFSRLKELKDIVSGGIVSGVSVNSFLVISGNDLMTKIVRK